MVRRPDPRLLTFLSAYDRGIQELALGLREIVLQEAPNAIEAVYDAYNAVAIGFSYTGRLKDSFCHIATYSAHVNLGLNRGASLPDPQHVLQGTGNAVRHIPIARPSDLQAPYLRSYLQAAIAQVPGPEARPSGIADVLIRGNYPKKRRPKKAAAH